MERAERAYEAGRQDGAAAVQWLVDNLVLTYWNDSHAVMIETLESMNAPKMVVDAMRGTL